jgi:hypothetical protein
MAVFSSRTINLLLLCKLHPLIQLVASLPSFDTCAWTVSTGWVSSKPLITEEIWSGWDLNPGHPNYTLALYTLFHHLMLRIFFCYGSKSKRITCGLSCGRSSWLAGSPISARKSHFPSYAEHEIKNFPKKWAQDKQEGSSGGILCILWPTTKKLKKNLFGMRRSGGIFFGDGVYLSTLVFPLHFTL